MEPYPDGRDGSQALDSDRPLLISHQLSSQPRGRVIDLSQPTPQPDPGWPVLARIAVAAERIAAALELLAYRDEPSPTARPRSPEQYETYLRMVNR